MTAYKYLLAADMDYTLLMPGTDISRANKEAIRKLSEAGIAFTIATGRTFFLIGKYTRELDIRIPCITSNGAALLDPITFSEIYSEDIPPKTLKEVFAKLLENDCNFAGYSDRAVYFSPTSNRRAFFDEYNKEIDKDIYARTADFTSELLVSEDFPRFNKILVVDANEDVLNWLRAREDIYGVFSADNFFDLMLPGISKGSALIELSKRLNIPLENVIAIGDNDNDLPMLEAAGISIAMGNSSDYIKSKCTHVTTNCDEDGFARAIEKFVLPLCT